MDGAKPLECGVSHDNAEPLECGVKAREAGRHAALALPFDVAWRWTLRNDVPRPSETACRDKWIADISPHGVISCLMASQDQPPMPSSPDPSPIGPIGPIGPIEKPPPWPHAPTHKLSAAGTYFVTAGTYLKLHHFRAKERLAVLHRGLLTVANDFGWALEAWAVFSNHYHFVAHSPPAKDSAESLSQMLGVLHKKTSKWINELDRTPGRQVWHNFRETRLTHTKSYLARLNYTHQNPVKHGLVEIASHYRWCSAGWLEENATPAQVKTIYSFRFDRLKVYDDFDVEGEL